MVNFKLHLRNIITLVVMLVLASCSGSAPMPELSFQVTVAELSDFSATIMVCHTGTNRVLYNVLVVPGDIIDVDKEIQKHQNRIASGSNKDEQYNQKKRVIKLSGLIPETQYTCIVYGVDENNEIIGVPCSTSFNTSSTSIVFSQNPKWELAYLGQSRYDGRTYSKILIQVEGKAEERYFVRIYNKKTIDEFSDLRSLLLYAYKDFCSERNELDDEFFWIEDKFVRTESTDYFMYLFKGDYQAFAIGIDANGNLTGHYACSNLFSFERYELEPEYADLLGDWLLTDNQGGEIYFTLNEKWANSTLSMSGFGFNDCPLTINYSLNGNYFLTIPGQSASGYTWGEDIKRIMTLRGWYLNEENIFRISTTQIISSLARAKGKNNDGTFTFTPGFSIKLNNGEKATTLGIILTSNNEDNTLFYYKSSKIQFPFTITKID